MKVGSHALIITLDNHIVLQERDNNPGISNPEWISMFGGTLADNEDPIEGLKRELYEELSLDLESYPYDKFRIYHKNLAQDGEDIEVDVFIVRSVDPSILKLHEGKSIKLLSFTDNLEDLKITRITKLAIIDYWHANPLPS